MGIVGTAFDLDGYADARDGWGYEATKQIRSHIKGQATAIIALTASAFEEARSVILAAGCDDFVGKPFQEEILFEKMAQYLGVEYIYEDEKEARSPLSVLSDISPSSRLVLTPQQLAVMPSEWVTQLYQEALKVNAKGITALIQHIPEPQAELAAILKKHVKQFQFDVIVNAARQILEVDSLP